MKTILFCTLSALVLLPALMGADFVNNQIEDHRPRVSFGRSYSPQKCRSCGMDECQVMGMQRFSEPRCESLGTLGAPCRMWQAPENKTLHFPNSILLCNDVYMQFCPCGPGLVCEEAECRFGSKSMTTSLNQKESHQQEREEATAFSDDAEDQMPVAFEPNRSGFPWAVERFH